MNPLPVSARRLTHRALDVQEGGLLRGSVLPLFDHQGRVQHLMILPDDCDDVYTMSWVPGLIRVPLWGRVRIRIHQKSLPRITTETAPDLRNLWHYDPWWRFREGLRALHTFAPQVRATNCAGRCTRNIIAVYFLRDCSRLRWVITRTWNTTQMISWSNSLLPAGPPPPEPAIPAKPNGGWTLDPVWK